MFKVQNHLKNNKSLETLQPLEVLALESSLGTLGRFSVRVFSNVFRRLCF